MCRRTCGKTHTRTRSVHTEASALLRPAPLVVSAVVFTCALSRVVGLSPDIRYILQLDYRITGVTSDVVGCRWLLPRTHARSLLGDTVTIGVATSDTRPSRTPWRKRHISLTGSSCNRWALLCCCRLHARCLLTKCKTRHDIREFQLCDIYVIVHRRTERGRADLKRTSGRTHRLCHFLSCLLFNY